MHVRSGMEEEWYTTQGLSRASDCPFSLETEAEIWGLRQNFLKAHTFENELKNNSPGTRIEERATKLYKTAICKNFGVKVAKNWMSNRICSNVKRKLTIFLKRKITGSSCPCIVCYTLTCIHIFVVVVVESEAFGELLTGVLKMFG